MKNLIFLFIIVISSYNGNAQVDSAKTGKHELKINVVSFVLNAPELTYERILNNHSSVGIAVLMGISEDSDYRYAALPYYRLYFGQKKANGLFFEGSTGLISSNQDRHHWDSMGNLTYVSPNWTSLGFGIAAGVKVLSRYGMFFEAYYGLGKLMGERKLLSRNYPRRGLTVGYRF